jgi:cysteine-rich repeat protein
VDGGPYVFSLGTTAVAAVAGINAYSGVHGATPIDVWLDRVGTSTSQVAPSITTTVANTRLVAFWSTANGDLAYTPPGSGNERYDVPSGGATLGITGSSSDEARAAIGLTGSRIATVATSTAYVAHHIALTTSLCANGMIDAGEDCDDGNTTAGDCCSPICKFESAATVCHTSTGACDPAETCTGSSATCPADVLSPNGTACGSAADTSCDNPDTCNGVSAACQSNLEAPGFACGDPTDSQCTNPDTCNGSGTCLSNDEAAGLACGSAADTECSNPDTCNGSGACGSNDEAVGVACGSATDTACSNPDTCNGMGTCQVNDEAAGFACGDPSNTD